MNARVNRKVSLLAALLLGGVIAVAVSVDAAAPWFSPGGVRPIPPGNRSRDRGPERDRGRGDGDRERRRAYYREQRFIRHLYQGFLNRQPSPYELREWSEQFGRDTHPTALVQEFMDSDEFFVRETFRGLLHREPDAAGLDAYLRALERGQSRADIVEAILASEEFSRKLR